MQKPPKFVDLTGVIVRRKELLDAGLTDRHVHALVKAGVYVRVRRGEYIDGEVWRSLKRADQHRVLTRAILRLAHPGATATHVSAAVEHGAPIWDLPLDVVHTTRRDGKAGRRRDDWIQHCAVLPADHVEMRNGIAVSAAARTCVEITTVADVERSLVVVNGLLNMGATTVGEFAALAENARYWPHSLTTDLVLRLCNGKLESAGETRFDYFCWRHHLPRPTPQVEVYDEDGRLVGRVDFLWSDHGVFVEFDGKEKYKKYRREGESLEEFLMREKAREEKICQLTGWVCIRVTWAGLAAPDVLARRVRKLLDSRRPIGA
ncbi:type IV toxin-antitoxin system AbiEi family antitoxin domain-containing protein [Nocardia sp. N13]|uniref:type IV toxin-antitoxin system AbiEi family antitoxin domain-containing protein n=1 Tax=Nocardioides sp. N13(2025) TaxID=3453405 RepID=UPI003F75DB0E